MLEQEPQGREALQDGLFRIGEVSRLTQTKPFVLRYWETEFPMLQPVKTPKGHRLYRSEDVEMVRAIKRLLYDEGFTIAGARRHLADNGPGAEAAPAGGNGHGNGHGEAVENERAGGGESGSPGTSHTGAGPSTRAERHVLRELRMELAAILTLLGGG